MKLYNIYSSTYHNGIEINNRYIGKSLTEKNIKENRYILTWDNIDKIYNEIPLYCNFNLFFLKRGRKISFFGGNLLDKNKKDIKEWKTKELNIEIVIKWNEIKHPTMEMLSKMDAIKVQKYLKEGLTSKPCYDII